PFLPGRWQRGRLQEFPNSTSCSTKRRRRLRPAAWSASTMLASPPPSWRTTQPASSPARPFTSTVVTTLSTSACVGPERQPKGPARLRKPAGMKRYVMAPKRTVGNNAEAKMKRKAYEQELRKLQVQLCHLQDWVKKTGTRIIILFEGRDA